MAKIVILAGGSAADEAKTALEGAGLECEVVEPTAENLLHIVIGMVGDDDKEEKKEKKEKKEEKPEAPAEEPTEPPAEEVPPAEDEVQEELGLAMIDGEAVKALSSKAATSTLYVGTLQTGSKTMYAVNESMFSFWPSDIERPAHRVVVEHNNHRASIELPVLALPGKLAAGQAYLSVGADLADLFKTK